MLKVGLIGCGAIGQCVIDTLPNLSEVDCEFVGILARPKPGQSRKLPAEIPVFEDINELLACKPNVVAECAGHQAVKAHGEAILRAGCDLVIISIGALAEQTTLEGLKDAAEEGNSRIYLPAGAIGGIDSLAAARVGGLNSVCYRARKPASAWKGSPAEKDWDLDWLDHEAVIFKGSAREAALLYPKNSNVAATVALAGLGFDRTNVELVADPAVTENIHEVVVDSKAGTFNIALSGNPSPYNPKTSALTANSVVRCLANLDTSIVI